MADICSLPSHKQCLAFSPYPPGALHLADGSAALHGNGCSSTVRAASLPGCKAITFYSSHHVARVSSEPGLETARSRIRQRAWQHEKDFRVSALAARSHSPTLCRPRHDEKDYIVWDAPREAGRAFTLDNEDEASTSGEGLWGKTERAAKARGTRHWLVEERGREGSDSKGFWTTEGEEEGPLPWYSQERVFDELFGRETFNAAGGVATSHRSPRKDADGWEELHTVPDSLPGPKPHPSPWQDSDGSFDLDEARADFQVLRGMLQDLRKGGRRKVQSQRWEGLPLPAARLVQGGLEKRSGVRAKSAGLLRGVTASESVGRPDRRPGVVVDVSESLGPLEAFLDASAQFGSAEDLVAAAEQPESERGFSHLPKAKTAAPAIPLLGVEERAVQNGVNFPAESVNAPWEGVNTLRKREVVSPNGTAALTEGTGCSLRGANGAERPVIGLNSSRGGAQPSTTGRKASGRKPQAGEAALQRVVRRLLEDDVLGGAEMPEGQRRERLEEPLQTSRGGMAEAMGREVGKERRRAQARAEGKLEGRKETQGGPELVSRISVNGTARPAIGDSEDTRRESAGRAPSGVAPQLEEPTSSSSGGSAPSNGAWKGKSVWRRDAPEAPSETRQEMGSPASSSSQNVVASNGAWKGRSVWRRDVGAASAEALSEPKAARSSSYSPPETPRTGPSEVEPVDESLVSAVVSAVTSLLDAEEGVSYQKLERVLEPWAGQVSQPGWERVMEELEGEGDWGAVLAVLAWMVGRHAGTEPEIERAFSNSYPGSEGALTGAFLWADLEGASESVSDRGCGNGQEGLVSGSGARAGLGKMAGGEPVRALLEREYGDSSILGGGVSVRPEERIRIDADVLERAVGDQACSCRICASSRGGGALFHEDEDDPLVSSGPGSGDENGLRLESALPGGLGAAQASFANRGVLEGRPAAPPKRRKRRRASLLSRNVCATAVRALGAAGRVPELLALLPHLGGSLAGQNLSKALVMHLARDGKVEEALSVLLSSPHRTVPLYNVVMDAASKAWLGHERVVAIFDLILSDGLDPTVWSYNTVLSALVRENMLPEAFYWLDEMRVRGCKPDAVSYNTLMGARVQFKVARGIFEQMLREGVTPNLRTFNVLIAAVAAIGDYEEAKTWVVRMKGMGIEPSQVTYNSLITACLNGGSGLDEALSVVEQMEDAGFFPDVVTYNILIGACSRFGWLEERNDLLAEMNSTGIKANDITRKMIALHRPDDLERGFRKRFEVCSVREQNVKVVVEKKGRRQRKVS
ncbi:putative Pentatricopeptide repeat domain containing protein [Klebsormidium nitens]|uniref:Putative Pentatricopeptide repeat domain containing protein n=1 Tax=Klebsormidium nitens TaxID=105231 RepID=A0A1Y1IL90_KLENI|nr:putative Pentatricopeptide repeat domain containing protein [Klebsormidium nitens]|eukprot:GAQ91433.1 putative Pentatricopeptide repeat domain containing protein [Klebsormidium nitens]